MKTIDIIHSKLKKFPNGYYGLSFLHDNKSGFVQCLLRETKGKLRIEFIESFPSKTGMGTKLINYIIKVCKEEKVDLEVVPAKRELVNFYSKLGFEHHLDGIMIRKYN